MVSGIRRILLPFVIGVLGLGVVHAHAEILDEVKARGTLRCGVDPGLPGFSEVDDQSKWSGFDVDYCRAIAAAVLGDATAVEFVPLTTKQRFRATRTGQVDVLIRDTGWTMARDTTFSLTFAGINFFNGYGFMVPKGLGVTSALELTGAKVCVETGSTGEVAVATYFKTHNMTYTPVSVADEAQQKEAYVSGLCNAYTGDTISLSAARLGLNPPGDNVLLPEILSKEPYGPMVRENDYRWFAVVRWVHFALLDAEELGVTSANVEKMKSSENADIRQLVGTEGDFGEGIGLTNDWAANAIKAVGNYGEIFERNLGAKSRFHMARGLNALWTDGGIQFAPPIR